MTRVMQHPIKTRRADSKTFCPMESWATSRKRTQNGTAPNNPALVMNLEPNLSENPPTSGEKSAGTTNEMKIRPAPVLVQPNVFLTKRGRELSNDARDVETTKQPKIATRTRGTRKSVMSGGSR